MESAPARACLSGSVSFLTATSRSSISSLAGHTLPMPPLPGGRDSEYRPASLPGDMKGRVTKDQDEQLSVPDA